MQIGLLRWRGRGGASWVNARYVFVYTCLCHSVPVFSFVRWRYRLLLPAFAFIFLHPRGPDHWSPLSWGRRACPGYRYGICSTFFARPPSCSCPKSGPSLPLGVFPFRFNSPQSSNSFFPSFFPQLPFLLQVESSHVSCFFLLCFLFPSFGSRLSFFPFFPGYSPSTPFLPSPSILQISSYHHRFHFLCHFLSLPAFTLLYSAPTVEQMKNTTLKRPFPPMFSACLLQNSRAS